LSSPIGGGAILEPRAFGEGRMALHFGRQKLNLHEAGHVIDPHVRHAAPGSADLCFLTRMWRGISPPS
jgi:hypothetical protein